MSKKKAILVNEVQRIQLLNSLPKRLSLSRVETMMLKPRDHLVLKVQVTPTLSEMALDDCQIAPLSFVHYRT